MAISDYKVSPAPGISKTLTFLFTLFVASSAGLFIGLFTASFPLPVYLLALLQIALIAAWYLLQAPHWTTVLFWAAYAVQSTILFGTVIRGLYYPIYLMMLVNLVVALVLRRALISWSLLGIYGGLYALVLLSLFNVYSDVNFDLFQRLFIIGVGILAYFQFNGKKALETFPNVQLWSGLIVAGWVIFIAVQQGFGEYRGGIGTANENHVSFIVGLGALPLFASQFNRLAIKLRRILYWGLLGVMAYAMLLLASRGMTVALVMAFAAIFARVIRNTRRSIPIMIAALIFGAIILSLPGGSSLVERFGQSDVASANGRLPLWIAAVSALRQATPLELLLGHGLDYNLTVTAGVVGFPFNMHNAYLQYALDYGLLGLFLFVGLHLMIIRLVWRSKDRLSLVAIGSLVFLMIANLTTTTADEFFYWIVIGFCMAVAARTNYQHESAATTPISEPNAQYTPDTVATPNVS